MSCCYCLGVILVDWPVLLKVHPCSMFLHLWIRTLTAVHWSPNHRCQTLFPFYFLNFFRSRHDVVPPEIIHSTLCWLSGFIEIISFCCGIELILLLVWVVKLNHKYGHFIMWNRWGKTFHIVRLDWTVSPKVNKII